MTPLFTGAPKAIVKEFSQQRVRRGRYVSAAAVGYQISRSLRFNSSDSAYLSRTPASAGNRKTWTWSAWVKRNKLGAGQEIWGAYTGTGNDEGLFYATFESDDKLHIYGWSSTFRKTTQVFRDVSAWYHIVIVADVTNGTANNRLRIYVNGSEITTFDTITNPASTSQFAINSASAHYIGADPYSPSSRKGDYMLADVYLLDGTATTPSTFAETDAITGQWVPKTPTGISYGTNGFHLPFSDNSGTTSTTLGKDSAGSNNFTPNNFSVASGSGNDSLVDSPTSYGTDTGAGGEVRGNYCTWNPIAKTNQALPALSNGNLDVGANTTGGNVLGTISVSSGKWYWEVTVTTVGTANVGATSVTISTSQPGYAANSSAYLSDGRVKNNASDVGTYSAFSANDVIGVALNMDAGEIKFYKNNTLIVTISSGISGTWVPAVGDWNASSSVMVANFGQRPFAYTAPSGFKALCDTNLPTPTIAKPSDYFDVKLYTGNGSTQIISGLNFSPDWVWIKNRSHGRDNNVYDTVRGATKLLSTNGTTFDVYNGTGSEQTVSGLTAFNSDGFTVGSNNVANQNTYTYGAWCWDGGSSTVTNTQGSITSTVRANASAGFSVVTVSKTGTGTIGHGLGIKPELIILKSRADVDGWYVHHSALAANQALFLNTTGAIATSSGYWNNALPTSTVFSVGTAIPNSNLVAYCFAPVAGYSAFGSYTGGGSSGRFVYTGFRPKLVWVKAYATGSYPTVQGWYMWDSVRGTYNYNQNNLNANTSYAEGIRNNGGAIESIGVDLLSNGFRLLGADDADTNWGGESYIYAAFAESPINYSRAR